MSCSFHNLSIDNSTRRKRSRQSFLLLCLLHFYTLFFFFRVRFFASLAHPAHSSIQPVIQQLVRSYNVCPVIFLLFNFYPPLPLSLFIEQLTSVYLGLFDKGRKHLKGGGEGNFYFIIRPPPSIWQLFIGISILSAVALWGGLIFIFLLAN